MRVALQHEDPDLQVLHWLATRLPPNNNKLCEQDLIFHTTQGNLKVVRWLHEHKLKISKLAIDRAAKCDRLTCSAISTSAAPSVAIAQHWTTLPRLVTWRS